MQISSKPPPAGKTLFPGNPPWLASRVEAVATFRSRDSLVPYLSFPGDPRGRWPDQALRYGHDTLSTICDRTRLLPLPPPHGIVRGGSSDTNHAPFRRHRRCRAGTRQGLPWPAAGGAGTNGRWRAQAGYRSDRNERGADPARDIANLAPGKEAILDDRSIIFPIEHLGNLGRGTYAVQAILHTNPDLNVPMCPAISTVRSSRSSSTPRSAARSRSSCRGPFRRRLWILIPSWSST